MKLRLLITKDCPKQCEGCCNKQWNLDTLPKITPSEMADYEEIMLTGGEPLLYPAMLIHVIRKIREAAPKPKIYLYTALTRIPLDFIMVLQKIDGACITIHDTEDVHPFLEFNKVFNEALEHYPELAEKSLRLNIFADTRFTFISDIWDVRNNMHWIENCPLPLDEEFMRLDYSEELFK